MTLHKPPPGMVNLRGVVEAFATTDDVERELQQRTVEMGFSAAKFAIMESAGQVKIPVIRTGPVEKHASVRYKTRDGTAKQHTDYKPEDSVVEFQPGDRMMVISISIVDDTTYEQDEEFYVDLYDPKCPG